MLIYVTNWPEVCLTLCSVCAPFHYIYIFEKINLCPILVYLNDHYYVCDYDYCNILSQTTKQYNLYEKYIGWYMWKEMSDWKHFQTQKKNIKLFFGFVWEKEFQRRRLLPWEFHVYPPNIGKIYFYVI